MFTAMLAVHSALRWLALAALAAGCLRAVYAWRRGAAFARYDGALRTAAVQLLQLQMVVGYVLYFYSPLVRLFWRDPAAALGQISVWFFGALHITLMTLAVIAATSGEALAKRVPDDRARFARFAAASGIALGLILIAIPWPFSPLATRPLLRGIF
jgi:hypothetical protein